MEAHNNHQSDKKETDPIPGSSAGDAHGVGVKASGTMGSLHGHHGAVREGEDPWDVKYPCVKIHKNQNYIRTTKYTLITFIPLNLYFQ
ncbi:hypothetical protein HDU76_005976, partial [Blyttiomyces sp. JEL0837]